METDLYQQFLFFREARLQQTTIIDGLFEKKREFGLAKRDPKTMKMYTKSKLENALLKTLKKLQNGSRN
jgi:hypothetical protein